MHSGRARSWRTLLVSAAAFALVLPLGVGTPGASAVTSEHLLSVPEGQIEHVTAAVQESGGTVLESFEVASALLVQLPNGARIPEDATVVPDVAMRFQAADAATGTPSPPAANTYRDTIGASSSLDGSGVTVALVDTGVADTGETRVTHVNVSDGPDGDGLGHGTFLSGIIAGDGASSGGAYSGVAPGARILDVQVAMPDGSTSLSKVLSGLQEVADRSAGDRTIKVVSLALSSGSPLPPNADPLTSALDRLWSRGLTVLVAAGNGGPKSVTSPASDPTLIAVGAVAENRTASRSDDTVADFSAYGKKFGSMRPDIAAPGVSLVSLRAPGSVADTENPDSRVLDKYFTGTGTSMSEAVAAGAAAALLGARPGLTPDQVKRLLVGTAYSAAGLTKGAGAGGLDLAAAAAAEVASTRPLPAAERSTRFAPDEADASTWAAFAAAWADGDLQAVIDAWKALSPQTRRWAASTWSLAVLERALATSEDDFELRVWEGRRWATEKWQGRRWATDEWVGRRWADEDWAGRRWAGRRWADEVWEGRRWAEDDWLAVAWTGRRWASTDWAGRRWADEAWAGRRWADFDWSGRRWADEVWEGRRWADVAWAGRRWATEVWNGRRWAVTGWGQ
ncbi:MAG: S8 family serine peptidase [Candidatus Nanopelagicales bacterium]|nr:S8 family serine peptidase [Candidatus Nanopelagicales bacterium]